MTKYLLTVDYHGGVIDTPMTEWAPEDVSAHMDYYRALNKELTERGELVAAEALTGPELAKVVTAGNGTAPVVTDGPFGEVKEWLAGYQIVEVDSEERALEIAARVSAVPGPGGRPTQQPIQVRRVLDDGPSDSGEMEEWLRTAGA
jgi:hypothetical protein